MLFQLLGKLFFYLYVLPWFATTLKKIVIPVTIRETARHIEAGTKKECNHQSMTRAEFEAKYPFRR